MKHWYKIGLLVSLSAMSVATFADTCSSLQGIGNSKSIIAALAASAKHGNYYTVSDVTSCIPQCAVTYADSPDAFAECTSSLNNVLYAINYRDTMNGLNPSEFSDDSSVGGNFQGFGSSFSNEPAAAIPAPAPAKQKQFIPKPSQPADNGYTPLPSNNNDDDSNKTYIRWN